MVSKFSKSVEYEYFTLYCLHEGIYAAIADVEGPTGSNAGFFDLGDSLIIFDTFLNLNAAKELIQVAKELTGKNPTFVINSHKHLDHIVGNCLIAPNIPIITTNAALHSIKENSPSDFKELKAVSKEEIAIEEKKLQSENLEERISADNTLRFYRAFQIPEVTLRIPNVALSKKLAITGTKLSVELINEGEAHTEEDLIAYFPTERILFCGDLLFSRRFPYIGAGNPLKWIKLMKKYLDMDIDIFVGGHGELGDKEALSLQMQYIEELYTLVRKRIKNDETALKISPLNFSEVFHTWKGPSFTSNYHFVVKQLTEMRNDI